MSLRCFMKSGPGAGGPGRGPQRSRLSCIGAKNVRAMTPPKLGILWPSGCQNDWIFSEALFRGLKRLILQPSIVEKNIRAVTPQSQAFWCQIRWETRSFFIVRAWEAWCTWGTSSSTAFRLSANGQNLRQRKKNSIKSGKKRPPFLPTLVPLIPSALRASGIKPTRVGKKGGLFFPP